MTTYSISLDDVDLALLPLRTHKYNDFLKKEYYQFQVMKTDTVKEPEPTILYTCHICAIEVPAAFAREHATSVKHRANARIASVAVERTRALITALPPPATAQPKARFCANCAITVGKNHEKTKEHRVAVTHDKLLWELMTAYVGDDDVNDYESTFSEDSDTDLNIINLKGKSSQDCNGFETIDTVNNKDEKQKKFDKTVAFSSIKTAKKEINKNETKVEEYQCKDNKNKSGEKTDKTESIRDGEKKYICTNSQNSKERETESNTNEYIATSTKPKVTQKKNEICTNSQNGKERETGISTNEDIASSSKSKATHMKNEICTNSQNGKETDPESSTNEDIGFSKPKPAQDNIKIDYVEFVTNSGNQVKVYSDYYHSFTRKMDTINCIVCSTAFKNNELDSHMFSLKHLNKMPSTLIDEHCVRQINDTYSHCILCNQIVKTCNVTKHYLTISHGQREKLAVTATHQVSSGIDNTPTRPANLDVKAANAQPKTQEKAKYTPNEPKSCLDWPVIYPYEVTRQENTVRCVICDCLVPNNPENRKGHLLGMNHAKNVKNKRLTNSHEYEVAEAPGIARCVTCDVNVTMSPSVLKEHLVGWKHVKNSICDRETLNGSCKSSIPLPEPSQLVTPGTKTLKSTDTVKPKSKDWYFSWYTRMSRLDHQKQQSSRTSHTQTDIQN